MYFIKLFSFTFWNLNFFFVNNWKTIFNKIGKKPIGRWPRPFLRLRLVGQNYEGTYRSLSFTYVKQIGQINGFLIGVLSPRNYFLGLVLWFSGKAAVPYWKTVNAENLSSRARTHCYLLHISASASTKCCYLQHFMDRETRKICLPLYFFFKRLANLTNPIP